MKLALIAHDIRSTHNVGSLLRTADGLGLEHVYLTGYTPYPAAPNDTRLPHLAAKINRDIHKTALGAEDTVHWTRVDDVEALIADLKADGWQIAALEQAADAAPLHTFRTDQPTVLLLGREVEGIDPALLKLCDICVEIPMHGGKESFNVVQAAAMALYHLRYMAAS